jgi:hypothetical protein
MNPLHQKLSFPCARKSRMPCPARRPCNITCHNTPAARPVNPLPTSPTRSCQSPVLVYSIACMRVTRHATRPALATPSRRSSPPIAQPPSQAQSRLRASSACQFLQSSRAVQIAITLTLHHLSSRPSLAQLGRQMLTGSRSSLRLLLLLLLLLASSCQLAPRGTNHRERCCAACLVSAPSA